ncbi:hypothetical protein ACIBRY_26520 [Streptomyces anulatus]
MSTTTVSDLNGPDLTAPDLTVSDLNGPVTTASGTTVPDPMCAVRAPKCSAGAPADRP